MFNLEAFLNEPQEDGFQDFIEHIETLPVKENIRAMKKVCIERPMLCRLRLFTNWAVRHVDDIHLVDEILAEERENA